jgi:hypothetical protein
MGIGALPRRNNGSRMTIAVVAVLVLVAGCGYVGTQRIEIRSQLEPPSICMDGRAAGRLVAHEEWGFVVDQWIVDWPYGYHATREWGRLALRSDAGKTIAFEGDAVLLHGGFRDGVFVACEARLSSIELQAST